MYYKGTQAQIQAYSNQVNAGENYDGTTCTGWCPIFEHPDGTEYAIIAHPDYSSTLTSVAALDDTWNP